MAKEKKYLFMVVPRRLFFATQQKKPSPVGLSNIKNPQFQEEKISAIKRARTHISMEKSSKNLIS
jgi:hypothetical protein